MLVRDPRGTGVQREPSLTPSPVVYAFLNKWRYTSFWSMTATYNNAARSFYNRGGCAILVPNEINSTVDFPDALAANLRLNHVDLLLVYLPALHTPISCWYVHPGAAQEQDIAAALRLIPNSTFCGGDFNASFHPRQEARRTDVHVTLGDGMHRQFSAAGFAPIPPNAKTTRASFIDGFWSGPNEHFVPLDEESVVQRPALIYDATRNTFLFGDHFPVTVTIAVAEHHIMDTIEVPARIKWEDVTPSHRKRFSDAVLRLVKTDGLELHDALSAAERFLPSTRPHTMLRTIGTSPWKDDILRLTNLLLESNSTSIWELKKKFVPLSLHGGRPIQPLDPAAPKWTTPIEKANGLGAFYSELHHAKHFPPRPVNVAPPPPVSRAETAHAISVARSNSAKDKHGICSRHLKTLLPEHAHLLLSDLAERALNGRIPDSWSVHVRVPLLKPGRPADTPSSYRPVALVDETLKCVDRIVCARKSFLVGQQAPVAAAVHPTQLAAKAVIPCILSISGLVQFAHDGFRRKTKFYPVDALILPRVRDTRLMRCEATLLVLIDQSDAYSLCPTEQIHDGMISHGLSTYVPFSRAVNANRSFVVRMQGCYSDTFPDHAGTLQGSSSSPIDFSIGTRSVSEAVAQSNVLMTDSLLDDLNFFHQAADWSELYDESEFALRNVHARFEELGLKITPKSKAILINGGRKPFETYVPRPTLQVNN